MNPTQPRVLIVGPTPPPLHGPAIFTRMILDSPVVQGAAELIHLDISDRRDLGNIGRLDVRNVWLALKHLAQVAWIGALKRPNVVYVQPSQNALAYLRDAGFIVLGRLSGARVVIHLHGEAFRHFRDTAGPFVRWLIDWTHRLVAEAWVLGEDLRGIYEGLVPGDRVRVMPNGIPEASLTAIREAVAARREGGEAGRGPDGGPLTVLHLGQLARSKGTDVVIRAVARLMVDGVPARLVLAGDWGSPEERDALGAVMDEVGAGAWTTLPGVVDGPDKAKLFADADVFVLLSRFPPGDGQPLAVLEAMAAGTVVVANPRGAIPETLARGEAGVLLEAGDASEVAEALASLCRNVERRRTLAHAAKERFKSLYTEEVCARAFAGGLLEVTKAP